MAVDQHMLRLSEKHRSGFWRESMSLQSKCIMECNASCFM